MHPFMDERNMFSGNRAEMEAAARAREAGHILGNDYVTGQLNEVEARGLDPIETANRLAGEAQAIEQMRHRDSFRGSSGAPSRPVTPSARKSPPVPMRAEQRHKANLEAVQAVYDSIDRKLAHNPPLPLTDQEAILQDMRVWQGYIKSQDKKIIVLSWTNTIYDLGTIFLILFSIACVFFSIGVIVERFFL